MVQTEVISLKYIDYEINFITYAHQKKRNVQLLVQIINASS